MCDEEPVVSNSVSNVKKNVSSSEGEYLRGTTIEYLCKKNFAQNVTLVTCDDAGKWQPPSIECIPGLYTNSFFFQFSHLN